MGKTSQKEQLEAAAEAVVESPVVVDAAEGDGNIGHPAVLVVKVPTEDGEQVQVHCVNGLDPLAAPSLLKLATKLQEQKLGI